MHKVLLTEGFVTPVLLNSLVNIFKSWINRNSLLGLWVRRIFQFGELEIYARCFSKPCGSRGVWPSKILAKLLEGKKAFALFSGGKDSLRATLYTMETIKIWKVKCEFKVIHVYTTIGLPETEQHVRKICGLLGLKREYSTLLNCIRPHMVLEGRTRLKRQRSTQT